MFASDLRCSDCAMGMVLCGVSSCGCRRLEDELSISCCSFRTNCTRIGSKVGEFMFPPMRELFRRKKLLGGRLSQPAMDESQLETQLRDTGPDLIISPKRPLSGPVSLNDVLLYGWVKHDDAMIYIDIPHIPYWGDEHQCAQTIFV